MTAHPMVTRAPSTALTLISALLALLFITAPGASATPTGNPFVADVGSTTRTEPEPLQTNPVELRLLDLTPASITPSDTLKVTAQITNRTAEPLTDLELELGIVRYKLSSETVLRNWYDGVEQIVAPARLDLAKLDKPLAPGQSRTITLTAPADDLRLLEYKDSAGPRGITVTARSANSPTELASIRTFLLWAPTPDVEPLRVSILTPITGPVPTPLDPGAWATRIQSDVHPGGRLNYLLESTKGHKDVTWAVDPELIAAAQNTADDDATTWADNLLTAATGREVFALEPHDPDVAALATIGTPPPLTDKQASPHPKNWRTDLRWPETDVVDNRTLDAAVAAKRPFVVTTAPPNGADEHPPAITQFDTSSGTATSLQADPELSELLTGTTPSTLTTPEARQLLLTKLAILGQTEPRELDHVLLTAPRGWIADPERTTEILNALESAPFIDLQPLSRLLGAPTTTIGHQTAPTTAEPQPGQLTARDLTALTNLSERIKSLSEVVPQPRELAIPFQSAMAAVTSVAWRANPQGRAQAIAATTAHGRDVLKSVTIVPGSNVNLISDRGDLPVTVRNQLDQDISIDVVLKPDDNRLSIDQLPTVIIPAGTSTGLNIPATAIGSGNVIVQVELRTPSGALIATPSEFKVRVRADWENVGTAILVGLLAITLLAGVIRTIRRGKRSTRMEPIQPPKSPESTT